MANKHIFTTSPFVAEATSKNKAGGKAYDLPDRMALAQYVLTGTFNQTYYASAEDQLAQTLKLCTKVDSEFIGKLAIYARNTALMRDTAALLVAYLAQHDIEVFKKVFHRVMLNGQMVRTFVQIIRSGVVGRKSFGTAIKREIQNWLNNRSNEDLFKDNVGNNPSIADVIKMTHPRAFSVEKNAMFSYLLGNPKDTWRLPDEVQWFENFKKNGGEVPPVRIEMLTSLNLTKDQWQEIAQKANWRTLKDNLNTFLRHGVFENKRTLDLVAENLADRRQVLKAKIFPYQLLNTFKAVNGGGMPQQITIALQDAMEYATENTPKFEGPVYFMLDVSDSMKHPITGVRQGATTTARCIDAGSLFAACILRNNREGVLVPFNSEILDVRLNPRDSVMTNADMLSKLCRGGTDCSVAMAHLNKIGAKGNNVILFSDNESWINGTGGYSCQATGRTRAQKGTELARQWKIYRQRNPNAKLACVDVTPGGTSQILDDKTVINVGSFSNHVYKVVGDFLNNVEGHWMDDIEKINLNEVKESKVKHEIEQEYAE